MTFELAGRGIRGVVLDIEGTTTPISFVYDVLFPFARRGLPSHSASISTQPGLRETFASLRDE